MKKIDDKKLDKIVGGDTISGTIINAFVNAIETIQDAGHLLGSAIRRIVEGNLCPLE